MNYLKWCANKEREMKANHVFMVSGSETELVNMVVQEIVDHFKVDKAQVVTISNQGKVKDIDAIINQPLFKQQVVIMRDVDRFERRAFLSTWIEDTGRVRDKRTILVMTAGSVRLRLGEDRWIPTSDYVAYIDCSAINEKNLGEFVKTYLPLATEGAVQKLIELCAGDMTRMIKEMEKIVLFKVIDEKLISELVFRGTDNDVVETLIEGRKQELLALDSSAVNMRRVVEVMTRRLCQQLHLIVLKGRIFDKIELIKRADIPPYLFSSRMKEVRELSQEQVWQRLALLREVDVQICHGNELGTLELLILKW